MPKSPLPCGVCGKETTKYEIEVVDPEHKGQAPYERAIGLDCHSVVEGEE